MGHGLDIVEIERLDVGGMVQDVAELAREAFELVGGELETGESGDVGHLVGGDPLGHEASRYWPRGQQRSPLGLVRSPAVTKHEFLSPAWIEAALALRDEYADQLPEPPIPVRMNLIVTDVPHGNATELAASIDTAETGLLPRFGHLEDPELTVTLEYEVAKSLFVEQDPEAVGQAFFGGRIRIDGDMTRIFLLQGLEPNEQQRSVAETVNARLLEITV